jgi:2-phospho-L-lactate guanylyltransferase
VKGVVAVVPIRSLCDGKQRLRPALADDRRRSMIVDMLERVLAAATGSGVLDAVAVVSPDPDALVLARTLGADAIAQPDDRPGLDAAIDLGRDWAVARRATALLALFGDLPLITADDVRNLVRRDAPVVIAPDRHDQGTNALLLRLGPAGREFRFQYGAGSKRRHVDEAHRLHLEVATAVAMGTAFDLDTPDDLANLTSATLASVARTERTA